MQRRLVVVLVGLVAACGARTTSRVAPPVMGPQPLAATGTSPPATVAAAPVPDGQCSEAKGSPHGAAFSCWTTAERCEAYREQQAARPTDGTTWMPCAPASLSCFRAAQAERFSWACSPGLERCEASRAEHAKRPFLTVDAACAPLSAAARQHRSTVQEPEALGLPR